MVFGKFETGYSMLLFEKRSFLLNNGVKIVFLEHISDCLRCDRVGNDVINKVGSLNSIINMSSSDLV